MMRPCFCTLGAKHVVGVPEDCFVFTGRRFSRRHNTLKILKKIGFADAQRRRSEGTKADSIVTSWFCTARSRRSHVSQNMSSPNSSRFDKPMFPNGLCRLADSTCHRHVYDSAIVTWLSVLYPGARKSGGPCFSLQTSC
ncbi:hypothetical protein IG631_04980 [Alternaria alternata]|nr:hypothetical protein IG631_04980 [Alternaria alternata]